VNLFPFNCLENWQTCKLHSD